MARLFADVIFALLASKLPSITRWYTFGIHLARQSLAFFTNQLLPRLLNKAYVPQPNQNDTEDFHAQVNKKSNSRWTATARLWRWQRVLDCP